MTATRRRGPYHRQPARRRVGIPPFRGGIVYEEMPCQRRRKYDAEFREGAVTIVRETGKPIAEVARELGIGAGTLGNWVKKDRLARGEDSDAHPGRSGLCAWPRA